LNAIKGRKTHMGGLALIFLAIGSVMQGLAEDTDIDWNRAIADVTIGASVLGINGKVSKKADK